MIEMESGWNLISIPVQLPDNTLDAAFQPIAGQYSSVWAYDAENSKWERYVVGGPDFLNSLETIEQGRGYWVQMADSAILTVGGQRAVDEPIQLKLGWNLVGYNSATAQSLEDALSSVAGNYSSVWTYDATTGEWKRHVVGGPGFLNNLETMEPGRGYWIDVVVDCIWDVNDITPPAAPPVAVVSGQRHVSTDRPRIPHTIWGSVEANGVKMTGRDRHGNAAPTILLKADGKERSRYRLGEVSQYGDYYVLDVPEAVDSSMWVELYVQSGDTVTKAASISPLTPGQTMRLDLYVIQTMPKASMLYQNYPNPFNPETWIPYQLREATDVTISVYSATGQLIRTLDLGHKPAGFYASKSKAAYWDGNNEVGEHVASGVYFYSVKAGSYAATKKMVVVQ